MQKLSDLSRQKLQHIVEQIQHLLYGEMKLNGVEVWNPEKAWDSETLEYVAEVLGEAGLAPEKHDC